MFFYKDAWDWKGKWQRIHTENTSQFMKDHNNADVGVTIQRFNSLTASPKEEYICPLYFDLDFEENPEISRVEAQKILNLFFTRYNIAEQNVKISFSGNKGFHIVLDERLFNITPRDDLINIIKLIALDIKTQLNLTSLDPNVYTKKRIWRLENSVHSKTGLYCIEISYSDLCNKSMEEIKAMAKTPQPEIWVEEDREIIEQDNDLLNLYAFYIKKHEDYKLAAELEPINPKLKKTTALPHCIKSLLDINNYTHHTRNKSLVALATFFKDMGKSKEETIQILTKWSLSIPSSTGEEELKTNAISVTNTVYSDDYHFSCAFIKSVSDKISCNADKCIVVDTKNQVNKNAIQINLYESTKSVFVDKKLNIESNISGKGDSPYVIPKNVELKCSSLVNTKICELCPFKKNRIQTVTFKKDRSLLKLIAVPSNMITKAIYTKSKIPKGCHSLPSIEVMDYYEVWEMIASPIIQSFADEENVFINRFCYYLGHECETNKNYSLMCSPVPEPKKQKNILLVNDVSQLDDDLTFNYEEDELKNILEKLSIFKPKDTSFDAVREKMYAIAHDISENVTEIYERDDLHIAIDLVYHSSLSLKLQQSDLHQDRGKMELLIIGDSGQAKSDVFEKIRKYYRAGMGTSGEASKRTGLVYSLKEHNGSWLVEWGLLVMQDRRLLCIDEFGETPDDEKQQLTHVRSSGIAECNGVVKAKAHARTRLILLSNPKFGDMSGYDYGVQAIKGIFKAPADIRRLDMLLTLNRNEVSAGVYDRKKKKEHKTHEYPPEHCQLLLKFVWSRNAKDIIFRDDALDMLLKNSTYLGKKYLCDIPLLEKSDMRYRLARIAVATAMRLFSTKDCKTVYVEVGHVEFATWYLDKIYSKPSCSLHSYAKAYRKQYILNDTKYAKFKNVIFSIFKTGFSSTPNYESIENLLELFQNNPIFTKTDISDMSGIDKDPIKLLFATLGNLKFLRKTQRGFSKTNSFVESIKKLLQELDNIEAGDTTLFPETEIKSDKSENDEEILYVES